jgi:hypothetical protein
MRNANQSKRRDKQELAAVADQSVSEDDAEVDVADGVNDHGSGSSDFGSDSDEEDMLHVDVDYNQQTSRSPGNESAEAHLHTTDAREASSGSAPGHDRLTRLIMLRYGDEQRSHHDGERRSNTISDDGHRSLRSDREPVPLEMRAEESEQSTASSVSNSCSVSSEDVSGHTAQTLDTTVQRDKARDMWYMFGTFVVSVVLAMAVAGTVDPLPRVQSAAIPAGVSYSKWEQFRHQATLTDGPALGRQPLRGPHLRKGEKILARTHGQASRDRHGC